MTDAGPVLRGGRPGRDQGRRRNRRTAAPPAGFVCVEHADVQGESAAAVLIGTQAFRGVHDHPGRTGRPRFVTVSSAIRGLLTSCTSPFYCH